SDPLVILLAVLVLVCVRIGIASAPKLFDEALAFIVSLKLLESLPLFIGDDVGDVFFQPIFVSFFDFRLDVARLLRRILLIVWLSLLRKSRGNGKSESEKSDGQAARSAWGHVNYSQENFGKTIKLSASVEIKRIC